jgi:hypothetical protein
MSAAPVSALETAKPSYKGLVLPISMIGLAVLLYFLLNPAGLLPHFTLWHFLTLALILFMAGLMSGLTGFAFSSYRSSDPFSAPADYGGSAVAGAFGV